MSRLRSMVQAHREGLVTLTLGLAALMIPVVVAVILVIALGGGSASTPASPRRLVESVFQDDDKLIYTSTATVSKTLDELRSLGVDRVRLTILWKAIAPAPSSSVAPSGFRASDPAAYPAASWFPYDRVVALASARGIGVDFDVTAPGPLWAMGGSSPTVKEAAQYRPQAAAFGAFVAALGTRYSGTYTITAPGGSPRVRLPRVNFWSVWNEPNQPGWLAPQWSTPANQSTSTASGPQPVAPALYRSYADAAWEALKRTGHATQSDTILIGEMASEGSEDHKPNSPIPPMSFLRALYCVDGGYRPLRGGAASAVGCSPHGNAGEFVTSHPALFEMSGFSHHPYSFFLAPAASLPDPNFVALANLNRIEVGLDAIFRTYGVSRRLAIYLTEYGYETNPPNPYRGVSLRRQSLYLNEAQYMSWLDPRVRSMSQFLLVDALPDPRFPVGSMRYWSTFQTGLEYADGRPKPSLNSYRLPIFIPQPSTPPGRPMVVWGMLRAAPNYTTQRAAIQWRAPHGVYRTLTTVSTSDPSGFLTAAVRLPGRGAVRISWVAPDGSTFHSRVVGVS